MGCGYGLMRWRRLRRGGLVDPEAARATARAVAGVRMDIDRPPPPPRPPASSYQPTTDDPCVLDVRGADDRCPYCGGDVPHRRGR